MRYVRRWALIFGVLSVILGAASWFAADYFHKRENERVNLIKARERLSVEAYQRQVPVSDKIWNKIREARTVGEWQALLRDEVKLLYGEERKEAERFIKAKIFEGYFWEAEQLLANAKSFLSEDINHPTAQLYLKRAKEIYGAMERLAPDLAEKPGDVNWNKRINYLKGKFYFRSLFFVEKPVEEQAKILDLITHSANFLSRTLEFAPKDNDTEIALEVLQKTTKAMSLAGGGDQTKLRLELLPAPSQEIRPQFGIDERKGGGRH